MGVTALSDLAAFQNAHTAAGTLLVAIDFTATWCGPCKQIGPVFESFATSGDFPFVRFFKMDVDENQETSAACGIRAMPTFQLYRCGAKVDELCGADAGKLRALLARHGTPPVWLAPQTEVVARGIQSRPALNGVRGVVRSFDAARGRYQIALEGESEPIALKRENLVCCARVRLAPAAADGDAPLPEALSGVGGARVCGIDEEDGSRYIVEVAGVKTPVPMGCVVPLSGSVGLVQNLQATPQHNGKPAHMLSVDGETGRFLVALEGNSLQLRLRPTNFRL